MHLPPLAHDQERARKLGREMDVHALTTDWGPEIVRLARAGQYGILILPIPAEAPDGARLKWIDFVRNQAPCPVALVTLPVIPQQVDE
jgi:hypothetical protein